MIWVRLPLVASALLCASNCFSQPQSPVKVEITQDDSPGAAIKFGPTVPARVYSTREAAKWAFDFIASPSRAKDRVLIYAYKLEDDNSAELVRKVLYEDAINSKDVILSAFVSEIRAGPLPMLGGDKGYYATPILSISSNAMAQSGFYSLDELSHELAPRVVGIAALKAVGINISNFDDTKWVLSNTSTYLGVNKPIAGRTPDQHFIIGESAWTVPEQQPTLTWGLSFLQSNAH
jgi:hypothetical protein